MLSCARKITDKIYWVGGDDRRLALFENLFPIPRGVSYNAYLISDEKTALLDTVDASVGRQFMENVDSILQGRTLDYVVVNHMEPDHCSLLDELVRRYPQAKVVGNQKTFQIISQFYRIDLEGRKVVVAENDTLSLGEHTLRFVMAPMVHWPEVMVAFEEKENLLFSADAFGTFGALNGNLFSDEVDFERDWLPDARRYYTNIVGKYGLQVQAALKKLSSLDIRMIAPLHGPVWRSNIPWFMGKYDLWSRYEPEDKAVAIFYGSMYGNTENAAQALASRMGEDGVRNVAMYDVSGTPVSQLIAETFRCSHILLACPTYNSGVYAPMETLLRDMQALGMRNRTFGILDNGSWAPMAGKQIREMLEKLKDVRFVGEGISIRSCAGGADREAVLALADAVAAELR